MPLIGGRAVLGGQHDPRPDRNQQPRGASASGSDQGPWWRFPLIVALTSRILTSLILIVAVTVFGHPTGTPPAAGAFTTWDGAWYLAIATHGYHAAPVDTANGLYDFAFWPAWPALLGVVVALVPGPTDLVAGLLANGLSIAAIIMWARVLEPVFGGRTARATITLLAFAPPAYVLSMAYSEPLFLVVSAGSFLAPTRGPLRPLLAAAAQATRLTGFAVGASAIPRILRSRGRNLSAWATLLAPLVAFAAWWIWLACLTDDPAGYLRGSPMWLVKTGLTAGPLSVIAHLGQPMYFLPILVAVLFLGIMIAGTVLLLRAHRWEFALYSVACLVPTLMLANWESMPRHALIAVPALAAMAERLSDRRRRSLVAGSVIAEIIAVGLVELGRLVP